MRPGLSNTWGVADLEGGARQEGAHHLGVHLPVATHVGVLGLLVVPRVDVRSSVVGVKALLQVLLSGEHCTVRQICLAIDVEIRHENLVPLRAGDNLHVVEFRANQPRLNQLEASF